MYFPIQDSSELFVSVCFRMYVFLHLVYFAGRRSLICLWLSSQDFRSSVCFQGCVSGSVVCILCRYSPGYKVSDLFVVCVPGCKVCEWSGGVFCRSLCLDSLRVCVLGCEVSVPISQHVRSVNILSLCVLGCDISNPFMCTVKHIRSLICLLCVFQDARFVNGLGVCFAGLYVWTL